MAESSGCSSRKRNWLLEGLNRKVGGKLGEIPGGGGCESHGRHRRRRGHGGVEEKEGFVR